MGQIIVWELRTTQVEDRVGVQSVSLGLYWVAHCPTLLFSFYKLEERVPVHVQPRAASGLLLDLCQPDSALLYFGKRWVWTFWVALFAFDTNSHPALPALPRVSTALISVPGETGWWEQPERFHFCRCVWWRRATGEISSDVTHMALSYSPRVFISEELLWSIH